MIYCFDLDGTICSSVENSQYHLATPDKVVVDEINRLFDLGNTIKIMTARGCVSGIDHTEITKNQLSEWGVKYHDLLMNIKPHAHYFIDDKGYNIVDWKKKIPNKKGIVAGAFDIIHPGYVRLFSDAKLFCTHLTIALHTDPSIDRENKLKPVHSISERTEVLLSMKNVDSVVYYSTEEQFHDYLKSKKYDIRFLGDDYLDGSYTGKDIDIEIVWLNRMNHQYSTTKLKEKIYQSVKLKRED